MKDLVLSICIPTFNRKDVLLAEVKEYLSVKDSRFQVVVQDNCSTDGTREALCAIQDNRLIYRKNEANLGAMPNEIKSLSDNASEYLLFTIDKDLVDINKLPVFIDYLEREEPNFGYVDLSNDKPFQILNIPKGLDSIKQTAYLSKHPSGYFWKRVLFEREICQSYFKNIDPYFDFPYEVINAHLSVNYSAAIVVMPLIINANMRNLSGKTLTYNENNIYYSCSKRLEAFQLYLSDLLSLNISLETKRLMSVVLLKRVLGQISISLKRLLRHKWLCERYNLKPRIVSTHEMLSNMHSAIRLFKEIAAAELGNRTVRIISAKCYVRNFLSICKWQLKESLIKPKNFEVKC